MVRVYNSPIPAYNNQLTQRPQAIRQVTIVYDLGAQNKKNGLNYGLTSDSIVHNLLKIGQFECIFVYYL